MTQLRLATFVALVTSFAPAVALAQDSSGAAAADVLFRQGRQLHEEKRYAEACPKFAESFKLDPATGALLALASCHEAEGKLASAWAEYNDVVARARRDNQPDRAETARQRAAAIEPKLAKLTILLAPGAGEVPGLQVKRGTLAIGSGSVGTALPIDRGEHTVEASAPGYQPYSTRVTIADGASQVLTLPRLVASAATTAPVVTAPPVVSGPPPQAAPLAAQPPPERPADKPGASGGSVLKPLGIVAIVGGVLAAGGGTFFGLQAISRYNDSNANNHCDAISVCDAEGKSARLDARSAGNLSTGLFVAGGVLLAGGITMVVVSGSQPSAPRAALTPTVSTQGGALSLRGAFQ